MANERTYLHLLEIERPNSQSFNFDSNGQLLIVDSKFAITAADLEPKYSQRAKFLFHVPPGLLVLRESLLAEEHSRVVRGGDIKTLVLEVFDEHTHPKSSIFVAPDYKLSFKFKQNSEIKDSKQIEAVLESAKPLHCTFYTFPNLLYDFVAQKIGRGR